MTNKVPFVGRARHGPAPATELRRGRRSCQGADERQCMVQQIDDLLLDSVKPRRGLDLSILDCPASQHTTASRRRGDGRRQ